AAIAIPLYANVQARARIAKAQADARALSLAISICSGHGGVAGVALCALPVFATNGQNQTAGPFMASVPNPPTGWQAYSYTPNSRSEERRVGKECRGTSVTQP